MFAAHRDLRRSREEARCAGRSRGRRRARLGPDQPGRRHVAAGEPRPLNVVGEPYRPCGSCKSRSACKAAFGGSFGSDLPQAQCIVDQQKVTRRDKMILMLDCTQAAAELIAEQGTSSPAGPRSPAAAQHVAATRLVPIATVRPAPPRRTAARRLTLRHSAQVLQRSPSWSVPT